MGVKELLEPVFHEVFDDDTIELRAEMTADEVDGWDSLSHVNLIVAIESKFKIRFSQKELLTFRTVGDLLNSIADKAQLSV
ncbi:MAG: acyl carrier protein [Desulfuromonadaceae bacterium]|nr:acyl carrier protein [Desulfuromonadaceae bacterium]